MTDATVLVTGATGFVGRRLVPALNERGFHVRAMTRRPHDYAGEAEPVGGDVHDVDSLLEPLLGVDVARTVDQRLQLVALGPRPPLVGLVEQGLPVAALGGSQQPLDVIARTRHPHTMSQEASGPAS